MAQGSKIWSLVLGILIGFLAHRAMATDFPLRAEFKTCPVIELDMLKHEFDDLLIVDVRSKLEFTVIQIVKAVNIPLHLINEGNLGKVRGKTAKSKLVFYCNGTTCKKSYEATLRAIKLGFQNVYAFDIGIEPLAKSDPTKVLIMGKKQTAESIKGDLLGTTEFTEHLLDAKRFLELAKDPSYMIIDIREPGERETYPVQLKHTKAIPIDNFITLLEKDRVIPKSNLLILDNVGKQVRWLQYYLKQYQRTNYHFLKDGVQTLPRDSEPNTGQNTED